MVSLAAVFVKICPELQYKYSTIKGALATICREFDLGDSHWPGDCANGILTVFLHYRRIFSDQNKWRQATLHCTDAQVNKLVALAAMFDGPKEFQGASGSSGSGAHVAEDAPEPRRQLAREVSAVSVDSQELPRLSFAERTPLRKREASRRCPPPSPRTVKGKCPSPVDELLREALDASPCQKQVSKKPAASPAVVPACRKRPAASSAADAAALPGARVPGCVEMGGQVYTRMFYRSSNSVGVRSGTAGPQLFSLTVKHFSREELFALAAEVLKKHHGGMSLAEAKTWALARAKP